MTDKAAVKRAQNRARFGFAEREITDAKPSANELARFAEVRRR